MDRFQEMRALVAVVEAGSFVAGAEALGLSTAAVSRQLGSLEARLGVRLLHRTTRRLSLTEEGEIFLDRARTLLGELDEAEAEITERSGQAAGQLRVNAPVSFGILHLAGLWGTFQARHPALELDVTLSDRMVDLVEEGYDVVVRIGHLSDSSLISRRLASTRMVLCASPAYLERNGRPGHPSDLAAHTVWAYRYFVRGDEWPFDGPDGRVTTRIRPTVRTNNGDTCRAGALASHCIVLQPSFLVGPDIRAGRLVEIMPDYQAPAPGIYAVYPSRRHVAPKVRLLIDFLMEAFRKPEWAV